MFKLGKGFVGYVIACIVASGLVKAIDQHQTDKYIDSLYE